MAFALLIAGSVLLIAAVRNTQGTLYALLRNDFTGQNNFIFWFVSILLIGAVGYIPKLKPLSVAFLTLVVVVLFITRGNPQTNTGGGFFQQFLAALNTTKAATPVPTQTGQQNPFGSVGPFSGLTI